MTYCSSLSSWKIEGNKYWQKEPRTSIAQRLIHIFDFAWSRWSSSHWKDKQSGVLLLKYTFMSWDFGLSPWAPLYMCYQQCKLLPELCSEWPFNAMLNSWGNFVYGRPFFRRPLLGGGKSYWTPAIQSRALCCVWLVFGPLLHQGGEGGRGGVLMPSSIADPGPPYPFFRNNSLKISLLAASLTEVFIWNI